MEHKETSKQQRPGMKHLNNLLKKIGEDVGRKPLEATANSLSQAESRAEAALKVRFSEQKKRINFDKPITSQPQKKDYSNILEASLKRYTTEKPSVYCYQDELLKYLQSKNCYFLIQPLKPQTKGSRLFAVGIEYFKDCYESNGLKRDTLLLAVYLWHCVSLRATLTPEELVKFLNPCLWLASKNED